MQGLDGMKVLVDSGVEDHCGILTRIRSQVEKLGKKMSCKAYDRKTGESRFVCARPFPKKIMSVYSF